FVESSELLERVAHRYGYKWLIKTNSKGSLYRIHLFNAVFFSIILIITGGAQRILAEMYAIGLWAISVIFFIIAGLQIARKRAPEIKEIERTDFPMELITRIAESDQETIHI